MRYQGRRIICFLWIVCLILLYIFANSIAALVMIIATIVISVSLIGFTVMEAKKLEVTLEAKGSVGERHQIIIKLIQCNKESKVPTCITAQLEIENLLSGDKQVITPSIPNDQIVIITKYCGKMEIRLKWLIISDIFGLIVIRKNLNISRAALVIPETYYVSEVGELTGLLDIEGNEYSNDKPGADPSETFAIREYVQGDRIKAIHWKLSNKLDTIMIRESGLPIKNSILILMETSYLLEAEDLKKQMDKVVTAVISLSEGLADKGLNHHIGWMDYKEQCFKIFEINSADGLINILADILAPGCKTGAEGALEKYYEEVPDSEFSHLTVVSDEITRQSNLFN